MLNVLSCTGEFHTAWTAPLQMPIICHGETIQEFPQWFRISSRFSATATPLLNGRVVTLGAGGRGHYLLSGLRNRELVCGERGLAQVYVKKEGKVTERDSCSHSYVNKRLALTTIQAHRKPCYLQTRLLTLERLSSSAKWTKQWCKPACGRKEGNRSRGKKRYTTGCCPKSQGSCSVSEAQVPLDQLKVAWKVDPRRWFSLETALWLERVGISRRGGDLGSKLCESTTPPVEGKHGLSLAILSVERTSVNLN